MQELEAGGVAANLLTGLGIDEYFTRTDVNGSRGLLADALSSTVALTDGTGAVQAEHTYEPFGATTTTGATTSPFQYTGRENDATGLYYYRARYYHAELSRFVAEDPVEFAGGDVNLYSYVGNTPFTLVDPLGLYSWELFVRDASNLSAGFGDAVSAGGTRLVRRVLDIDGVVDPCSTLYQVGGWGGIGVGTALGGAAGWASGGTKIRGVTEFSHFLPDRWYGPRSKWNGNWVTPWRAYKHDPHRWPVGYKDWGPKWPPGLQQLDRIPNVYKGAGAGAGVGLFGKSGCG